MTRAQIHLKGRILEISGGDSPAWSEARPFANDDLEKCRNWSDRYRAALGKSDQAELLMAIGQEIYVWLDGGAQWMEKLLEAAVPPLLVDFVVSPHPAADEMAFLEAPWELTADDDHLAGNGRIMFQPTRRFGAPGGPLPPSDYRLSLVFMAAAPEGVPDLFYEYEETAIQDAAGSAGLDLTVEESGSSRYLLDCLSHAAPVDVLHISCHGTIEPDRQTGLPATKLLLENDFRDADPQTAAELAGELGENLPQRLLFLSACMTADPQFGSIAAEFAQRGCPATLGWSGSVADGDATRFAAIFYRRISHRESLETAVARARQELFFPPGGGEPSKDWHLARLYLRSNGGGPLTRSDQARRNIDPDLGHKEFLNEKDQEVPVASRREFVGRRRQLQAVLREFRQPTKAGVLLHGMGRHGKSSLAARAAHRLPDYTLVLIVKKYDAGAILARLKRFISLEKTDAIIDKYAASAAENPDKLRLALREIIDDGEPGRSEKPPTRPILLIVDDFERALDDPPPGAGGLHRVKPVASEAIAALLAAFDGARTKSRLLFTSRHKFTLPRQGRDLAELLEPVPLPPMKDYESLKQAAAKQLQIETDRLKRCIRVARGNPGLQDRLARLAASDPKECDKALNAMVEYLKSGASPDQAVVQEFLENLAIDHLIDILSPAERQFLRATAFFEMPIPNEALKDLCRDLGATDPDACFGRLIAFGLWNVFGDPIDGKPAAMVDPLVKPKLRALNENEQKSMAEKTVRPLFRAWGGSSAERPWMADYELARLANLSRTPDVLIFSAMNAILHLRDGERLKEAAEVGRRAVAILDECGRPPPVGLLSAAGEAAQQIGEMADANRFLERAIASSEAVSKEERAGALLRYAQALGQSGEVDRALVALEKAGSLFQEIGYMRENAIVLGDIARIRVAKGEVDQALRLHEEMLQVFEDLGDRRERAITLGDIARIRVDKGEVDQALRLHEERLQVFEDLGDRRSRAVTLGDIARIRVAKGEVDQALRLHEEMLQVFEDLGDRRSRAVTLGDIARIRVAKGEVDQALRLHEEMLQVFEDLGDRRERAITLGDIARIRVDKGEVDQALRLHEERLQVFEDLGDRRSRAVTLGDIARIRVAKGEVDQALRLHEEMLQVFEDLGDRRSRAVTLGDIARIRVDKGEVDQALRLHEERLQVFEDLGDRRSRAVTLGDIARIRVAKGEVDQALRLHEEELAVYEDLGDRRSRAVTLGDIARIRVAKGEVDQALRLHEEMLQVFEDLGDRRSRAVTLGDIARIRVAKGEVDQALRLHEEMLQVFEDLGDRRSRAVTLGDIARIRVDKGEVDQALRLHEERLQVFEDLGDRRSRAVTLGDIARIRVAKGEVDQALRLHEEMLQVFEDLGDRRSRAVTLGDIARIRVDKGEVDQALRLHEERLQVFEDLGDLDGKANALWSIAQIEIGKRKFAEALKRLSESYQILMKIGRLDGIAMVGLDLGRLLFAAGRRKEGLIILERSRDGLATLGQPDFAAQVENLMNRLKEMPEPNTSE